MAATDPIVQAFQTMHGRPPTAAELSQLTNNGANSLTQNQVVADKLLAADPSGRNTSVSLPGGINSDAEVDQTNNYLRNQPFYKQMLGWMGQDPSKVKLSDSQRQTLLEAIKNAGINVSDHFEVDASGNLQPKSGLGKKILIGAAIGGAALTGLGLAGVGPMAGLFGGAGAAGAAGAAVPEMTVASSGVPAIAAGTSLGVGGLAGGAGAAGAAAGGAGTIQAIGSALKGGSKLSSLLGAAGTGIGDAATAAGNNALDQEKLALQANQENISGNSAFENALLGRSQEEDKQRADALKNMYRASFAANPRVSPFDPSGGPNLSPAYMAALKNLESQGSTMLSGPAKYQMSTAPDLTPYKPINIADVQGATNTKPGTLQKIGNIVGPALSIGSKIVPMFGG